MNLQALQQILDQAVINHEVAGASLLVVQNSEEKCFLKSGMADYEAQKPFSRDTIIRLFSATKPITAVAAMILMERGLLDPGAYLSDYLPEFEMLTVIDENKNIIPCSRKILVKELLDMTSGIPYGGHVNDPASMQVQAVFDEIINQLYSKNTITTQDFMKKIAQCPLSFVPGTKWAYGASADIMGALIEHISGMRFSEFLEKEIFIPLEMKDTGFYVPPQKQDRLAKVYASDASFLFEYPTDNLGIKYTVNVPPAFESGGAGLVSTIDDYMKFAQMLLNQGKYKNHQILSPKMITYLTKSQLMPWQQTSMNQCLETLNGYSYGNYLRIMKNPRQATMLSTEGEYGWDGWLGFYFINSPKDHLTMLMACQLKDAGTFSLTRKLKNVVWNQLV